MYGVKNTKYHVIHSCTQLQVGQYGHLKLCLYSHEIWFALPYFRKRKDKIFL